MHKFNKYNKVKQDQIRAETSVAESVNGGLVLGGFEEGYKGDSTELQSLSAKPMRPLSISCKTS
jgi:hypothetical protein